MSTAEAEEQRSSFDGLKWLLVVAIVVAAIWANQEYAEFPSAYRILAIMGASLLALVIALTTVKGRTFKLFAHEARIEARKVVWPNRREIVQTTFIVIAFTIFVALILWGIDVSWGAIIDWIMGLGA